jgi:hypothetical protein
LESSSPIAFVTTPWSVVQQAQAESPEATAALKQLCCNCWRPLYAFAMSQGLGPEGAQDRFPDFIAGIARRKELQQCRQEKGPLRSRPMSLKHFLGAKAAPITRTVAQ